MMYFTFKTPFLKCSLPVRNSCFCFIGNMAATLVNTRIIINPTFLLPKTDYGKKSLFFNGSCFLYIYYVYICIYSLRVYTYMRGVSNAAARIQISILEAAA